jgi:hypothetical protein
MLAETKKTVHCDFLTMSIGKMFASYYKLVSSLEWNLLNPQKAPSEGSKRSALLSERADRTAPVRERELFEQLFRSKELHFELELVHP